MNVRVRMHTMCTTRRMHGKKKKETSARLSEWEPGGKLADEKGRYLWWRKCLPASRLRIAQFHGNRESEREEFYNFTGRTRNPFRNFHRVC